MINDFSADIISISKITQLHLSSPASTGNRCRHFHHHTTLEGMLERFFSPAQHFHATHGKVKTQKPFDGKNVADVAEFEFISH
jgi:hypothetical protein